MSAEFGFIAGESNEESKVLAQATLCGSLSLDKKGVGMNFLMVGLGGFAGSLARYGVYLWLGSKDVTSFPWATLAVNMVGCFVIGLLSGLVEKSFPNSEAIYLFGSVGFLGAFTTFSAFGLETWSLLRHQEVVLAAVNILVSLVVGMFLVWCGRSLAVLA